MCQDIKAFEKILDDFKRVYNPNKPQYEPSYLEICSYPRNRLEEICSRLFAFFFNSNKPHGMGSLFFDTLLEVYQEIYTQENGQIDEFEYSQCVDAEIEVYTEKGNRIDLLLSTDNLKICIENKIDAPVDNDLEDYSQYVKSICDKSTVLFILLALYEKDEYKRLKGEFKVIFYKDFINKLKQNLGEYLTQCDARYLAILTDFIRFLERKGGYMTDLTEEERKFFNNHNEMIEHLIERHNQFLIENDNKYEIRRDIIIDDLNKKEHSALTGEWWKYAKKGIGAHFEKGNKDYEIGIEAGFTIDGEFNINLSVWKWSGQNKRISLYKPIIEKRFDCKQISNNGKWDVLIKKIKTEDNDEITNELYNIYKEVEDVVKNQKKEQ